MGYPSGIITFTENTAVGQTIQPAYFNDPYNEIVAIETGLLNGFAHTIKFTPDNTYNIGASGADRPANLYVANSIVLNGTKVSPHNVVSEQFNGSTTISSTSLVSTGIGAGAWAPVAVTEALITTSFELLSTAGAGAFIALYRSTSGVPAAGTSIPGGDTQLWEIGEISIAAINAWDFRSWKWRDTGLTLGTSYYYYLGAQTVNNNFAIGGGPYSVIVEE